MRKYIIVFLASIVILPFQAAAKPPGMNGICTVSIATHNGQRFAALKCHLDNEPGEFKIRSVIWEKNNKKAYNRVARFAGRRFACTLTKGGTSRKGMMEITHYDVDNCR